MGAFDDVLKRAGNSVKTVAKGGKVLHSNEGITNIAGTILNNSLGAVEVGARMMGKATGQNGKGVGITKALSDTFKNSDGSLKYGKIAGSYIGVSAAARVASGGGLYKDRNGNTNIAGVPFI